ncbi:tRNA pseudouridine synthase B [Synechococcus sp. KORDI-52]|uniref:tRNA pseudouridine(55) synthase TruB n=1 Tax=Synechococcus sp. KORDI-52 TaxID=585425 RepID=UPI0004E0AD3C|nr:tRNA pseudouridine(55) synthase TruB [Synechococcus sp. KORDI-52]AII48584.1 tRNA pseudouridine synthase B [Synechococcus sp. KORDI-52]
MQQSGHPAPASVNGPFGFVVIDKPAGLTSHACVSRLRRSYGLKRVGHGGTLDPAVTGVLPIALGPATRLLPYLPGDKTYKGVIQLGRRTNSDDLEGKLLEQQVWPSLSTDELDAALEPFRGAIEQRPPQVSAIHVNGERAYARARRGEAMELPLRAVTVHRLKLLHWNAALGQLNIEVHCSAGTYIRSIARDLGATLGCGGCLASLRRTQALGFHAHQAHPLPERDAPPPDPVSPLLALGALPRRNLSENEQIDWRCGRRIAMERGAGETVVVCNADGSLAGIGHREDEDLLRPKVVFDAAG